MSFLFLLKSIHETNETFHEIYDYLENRDKNRTSIFTIAFWLVQYLATLDSLPANRRYRLGKA